MQGVVQRYRWLPIPDRRKQPFRRQTLCYLIGKDANAVAGLLGAGGARERHRLRAIGPRPRIRGERQGHFVDAVLEFDAEPFVRPERGRVADRGQCKGAREGERVALVPRVPVGETDVAPDSVRPAIASISVSEIGIEAEMPVVVATPSSTTNRRSST